MIVAFDLPQKHAEFILAQIEGARSVGEGDAEAVSLYCYLLCCVALCKEEHKAEKSKKEKTK